MKNAYIAMQQELHDQKAIKDVQRISTTEFSLIRPILTLLESKEGRFPAASLDLLLHETDDIASHMGRLTSNISLEQWMYRTMPQFYRILYKTGGDPDLLDIDENEIDDFFGVKPNIHPIATL
jgi:hypothetical protein